MGKRMGYDQDQAAGRLRVTRYAYRWAVHAGVVPAPDAGPATWSRAAVESMSADAIRTAMGEEPLSGRQAADRLAEALGTPNPPGGPATVSVAAVIELAKEGLLVSLSADPVQPLLHTGQVDALAAAPGLAALLAEVAPLGPDQAAARLAVRRSDWDHVVRLGWISPDQEVRARFGAAAGGTVWIPLYRAARIDRVPADHPEVDWPALRALGKGQRSPLAKLTQACADR
ncbi:hypothetical protein ACIBEA_41480 [Streptomyces sp. NPDC051555]|uniref:hypothetical protein n=1 Tax=Streptomyces sp. NPDC051555 TaxID=3365657 RepID=UPI00379F6428